VDRKNIITYAAGALLAATTAVSIAGWRSAYLDNQQLSAREAEHIRHEMRSAIDRSVSAQMEEIAYEQREISDEQREEALAQTRVANEMRLRSERERQNAIEAERSAVASEKKAREASALAESQRQMAEHQRIQAEFSKRVADTLSYIALGRSLGSISTIQAQAGNEDLANMLSYTSYIYTSRYRGDIYNPAVFESLMRSSQSMRTWAECTGAVMNIEMMPNTTNRLVCVSNYGEIVLVERQGNRLTSHRIFENSAFDFRDLIVTPDSAIYAVSRTGQLVFIDKDLKTTKIIALDGMANPNRIHYMSEKRIIVFGERSVAVVETKRKIINATRQLPFRITLCSRKEGLPIVFDDKGRMHIVRGFDNMETLKVPVEGTVTAYCESKNTGYEAYGMSDGSIYLTDRSGKVQKLLGHRSRISKLKLNGRRLYSASYDGRVNLWITNSEKIEPMTLLTTGAWIMHFNFDSTKNTFWMGDAKGNLTAVNISVKIMVDEVRKKLKRDFTPDEWNYFIGQNVPYESITGARKEGGI